MDRVRVMEIFMESLLEWVRTSVNWWHQQHEKQNELLSKLITIVRRHLFHDVRQLEIIATRIHTREFAVAQTKLAV